MNIDQKISARMQKLLEDGEKLLQTKSKTSENGTTYLVGYGVNSELGYQWGTSSLHILSQVFGKNSDHYAKFDALFRDFDSYSSVKKAMGILRAALDDYANGYLFNTRVLIQAEVFDDFLEQAQHLLVSGYYGPAAVVAGSVLEDGLRKLCQRHNITLPSKPKLDTMNADLAKAAVYNLLVQKRITALADLRNKAAHGQWKEFTMEDVDQMLSQVRAFMETHFS